MEDHKEGKSKAERRQERKGRRKFKLHGGGLRTMYRDAIMKRTLKGKGEK